MREKRLVPGTRVKTVKPEKESTDWEPSALKLRRWGVLGYVQEHSDSHGLVYKVEHEDDKTTAWYEPRELVECDKVPPTTHLEKIDAALS